MSDEHKGFNRVKEVIDQNTGEVLHRERLDANKNFVMLFRDKIHIVRDLIVSHPTSATILLFLVEHMDGSNCVFMSQRTMGELTDMSAATVNRAISVLVDRKIMDRIYVGNLVGYAINANLAWTTHSNGRRYAHLKADMVISEHEQIKPRPKIKKIKTVNVNHSTINPQQMTLFPEE